MNVVNLLRSLSVSLFIVSGRRPSRPQCEVAHRGLCSLNVQELAAKDRYIYPRNTGLLPFSTFNVSLGRSIPNDLPISNFHPVFDRFLLSSRRRFSSHKIPFHVREIPPVKIIPFPPHNRPSPTSRHRRLFLPHKTFKIKKERSSDN